tara:strand:+ start:1073 stop:1366 length:294 start_codon:yes stop_codon:yes gene_type:complete
MKRIINGMWYDAEKSIPIASNGNNYDWVSSEDLNYYRETLEVTKKGNLFLFDEPCMGRDGSITAIDKDTAIEWCEEQEAKIINLKKFKTIIGILPEA